MPVQPGVTTLRTGGRQSGAISAAHAAEIGIITSHYSRAELGEGPSRSPLEPMTGHSRVVLPVTAVDWTNIRGSRSTNGPGLNARSHSLDACSITSWTNPA
jgi:hypothetical protein